MLVRDLKKVGMNRERVDTGCESLKIGESTEIYMGTGAVRTGGSWREKTCIGKIESEDVLPPGPISLVS